MSVVLTNKEIEELLNPPPMKEILPRAKKLSSIEEAIEAFNNSDSIKGSEGHNGVISYDKLGNFIKEDEECYWFLSYPYTSIKPIDYEFVFWVFIYKELDYISFSSAPISVYILREEEKKLGINNLEPKEDLVKTVEQARTILENSYLVKGIKHWKKKIVFHYKIGPFYAEYSSAFAFIGYPYTSSTQINQNKAGLLFVDKWLGNVAPDYHRLTDEELKDNSKYQLDHWQKLGQFDWQKPDSEDKMIFDIDEYMKLWKD